MTEVEIQHISQDGRHSYGYAYDVAAAIIKHQGMWIFLGT